MIVCTFACGSLNVIGSKFWETYPKSIWLFIEGQAFSVSYALTPRPPLSSSLVSKLDRQHKEDWKREAPDWRGGRRHVRSLITRPQESLVLCKSFNTLWTYFIDTKWIALFRKLTVRNSCDVLWPYMDWITRWIVFWRPMIQNSVLSVQ